MQRELKRQQPSVEPSDLSRAAYIVDICPDKLSHRFDLEQGKR